MIRKWLAAVVAIGAIFVAGMLWQRGARQATALRLPSTSAARAMVDAPAAAASTEPLVAPVSDVTPLDREAKRFNRYDKDKDGAITRDEYFANRRKQFAKLDTNHDGKLGFDEWSVKAIAKFDGADTDRNGKLTPAEFATTAVKRKARSKAVCPPGTPVAAAPEEPADAQ